MSPDGSAAPEALRARIQRYYGGDCRILAVRRAGRPGAYLFVIDALQRQRLIRTLGTIGRGGGSVMEHSALDLARPERLVFNYEREMLVSLALVPEPRAALLLGLGGGAMCRHLAAYLPELRVTVVERDREVIALARQHFHLAREVIQADAMEMVADVRRAFDVVMVDLYDAAGASPLEESFWDDCRAALRPGGVIAVNWAGSLQGGLPRHDIERAMACLPGSFLVIERGRRPNYVQIAPSDPGFRLGALAARVHAFAARHKLPREDRDVLLRAEVTPRYPAAGKRSRT
jgi:predicted O-methyltransferase YrrM